MNLENKHTLGILTVLIGRENCIDPLFEYFQEVKIPTQFSRPTLYFVKSFNENFQKLFEEKISEYGLKDKYCDVVIIEGVPKVKNEDDWEKWEKFVRQENPTDKHKSTAENLHRGISEVIKHNEYVHIVDDDTIPPVFALNKMCVPLIYDDEVGMVSGMYFCKGWTSPSLTKGEEELKRKIVVSVETDRWENSTLEDLLGETHNISSVGFVGNGCILVSTNYLKNVLPLNNIEEEFNTKGPDWYISYKIREQGKIIRLVTSVLCRHLDENGNEVGLQSSYLKKIISDEGEKHRYLISIFSPKINYMSLLNKFDYIKIIVFDEVKALLYKKYKKHLNLLLQNDKIEIIEKNVGVYREKYKNFRPHLERFKYHILHDYCLEIMNNNHNYNITLQPTWKRMVDEKINRSLNSNNLRLLIMP